MASSSSPWECPEPEPPGWLSRFMESAGETYNATMGLLRASHQHQEEIGRKDIELTAAHKRIRQLEAEVDQYQSQIFRSITTFKVSDSSISDELSSLYEGLSNWVVGLPDSRCFAQDWPDVHMFLQANGFPNSNFTSRAEVITYAEAELLTAAAFRVLWAVLFEPSPIGLSSENRVFLELVQSTMSLLEPKKDRAAINAWRSDTIRAWSRSSQYGGIVEHECGRALKAILRVFALGGAAADDHWDERANRLVEQVLRPAAALATEIRCSPDEYRWDWAAQFSAEVQKHHLDTWECIDLSTHCQVRNQNLEHVLGGFTIGDFVIPIFPALYRLRDGGEIRCLVRKGQLLVDTDGLVRRIKGRQSPRLTHDESQQSHTHEPDVAMDNPSPSRPQRSSSRLFSSKFKRPGLNCFD